MINWVFRWLCFSNVEIGFRSTAVHCTNRVIFVVIEARWIQRSDLFTNFLFNLYSFIQTCVFFLANFSCFLFFQSIHKSNHHTLTAAIHKCIQFTHIMVRSTDRTTTKRSKQTRHNNYYDSYRIQICWTKKNDGRITQTQRDEQTIIGERHAKLDQENLLISFLAICEK